MMTYMYPSLSYERCQLTQGFLLVQNSYFIGGGGFSQEHIMLWTFKSVTYLKADHCYHIYLKYVKTDSPNRH